MNHDDVAPLHFLPDPLLQDCAIDRLTVNPRELEPHRAAVKSVQLEIVQPRFLPLLPVAASLALIAGRASAHPSSGIVVDGDGNVFVADINTGL